MRAFFSIVLALLFLSSALMLLRMNRAMAETLHAARLQALHIEAFHGHEVEMKRAIIDTISITNAYAEILLGIEKQRITIDDKIVLIGRQLILFEGQIEHEFNKLHGISVDVWCGSITPLERAQLAERMIAQGRVLKCTNCYDWSSISIYKGVPTSICAAALMINPLTGDVTVREDPDLLFVPTLSGRPSFGASIYDAKRRLASVVMLPAGTVIK